MSKILVPSRSADSWKAFLAKPDLHWAVGKSARSLGHCWESADPIPNEVAELMTAAFGPAELLMAIPEHKTPLPGGTRESQSDILAIVRHPDGLATYTIEGQVDEPFGPLVSEWQAQASPGKAERLSYLCSILGLSQCPPNVRYQLLHRTASALIEAERFDATFAGMIVHSFSPTSMWFSDFAQFVRMLGGPPDVSPGEVITLQVPGIRPLMLGWAAGDKRFREA